MLPLPTSRLALRPGAVVAEPAGPLLDAVGDALVREPAGGVVVLGDFGSGKSTLCRTLAASGLPDGRPATLVPLASVAGHRDVEEGLLRVAGPARLDEARHDRRVLLLDGFDEIPETAPGRHREVFDELTRLVGPRWLLTSRPGHLRTDVDVDPDQADSLAREDVVTLSIDPLDRAVVRATVGALPGGAALLRTVEGLEDLATSPLLLDIVHGALPFIEAGRPIHAWGILDAWLRFALRTGPDHDDVLQRLEDLAWSAFRESGYGTETFAFRADQVSGARIPAALRRTLLVTELDGRVQFGHRSLFEFLLAGHMAPRLASGQGHGPDELTGLRLTEATRAFLVGRTGPMPVRIGPDRTWIPRGNFVAGGTRAPDERRLRIAHLHDPIWMARAPVTGAEWARHLADTPDHRLDAGYLPHWGPDRRLPRGHGELPVFGIWPEDADRYAAWAGARLPTADAWEKAVRGIDGRTWPWGDHWRPGFAVTAELGVKLPLPARALGAHGDAALFDAVGGVFETTSSWWRDRPDRGRVVMGGCYTHPASTARPSLRLSHRLSGHLKAGLRLAWDAA